MNTYSHFSIVRTLLEACNNIRKHNHECGWGIRRNARTKEKKFERKFTTSERENINIPDMDFINDRFTVHILCRSKRSGVENTGFFVRLLLFYEQLQQFLLEFLRARSRRGWG